MKLSHVLSALVLGSSLALAAPATLAIVNTKTITTNDANAFLAKAMPGMSFNKLDPKMKKEVVNTLVNQVLIKDQVLRSGIQKTPQFAQRYAALKDDLAVEMWMSQQMAKVSVSDKEARAFYTANSAKMVQNGKKISYEMAKPEIMQYLKLEKFKAMMTQNSDQLRKAAKIQMKI